MKSRLPEEYTSKRLVRSAEICLHTSLQQVFLLFGALREKDWVAGWDPRVLFSESGDIEERMVFLTTSPKGHTEGDYTWVVSRYSPDDALVEYTVFTPERVWWIEVCCREGQHPKETLARVTYTFNGLTPHGDVLNRAAADRMFAHNLLDWEEAINHYLHTGTQMAH